MLGLWGPLALEQPVRADLAREHEGQIQALPLFAAASE
jgi:hypothetical protein